MSIDFFNSLDKGNLGNAKTDGMDVGMFDPQTRKS
jgi:hypothetical protein